MEQVVDKVLAVRSWGSWMGYLVGQESPTSLPVARALEGQVFGGAVDQVEALAAEHTAFIRENCQQQVDTYVAWAETRRRSSTPTGEYHEYQYQYQYQ